MKPCHIAIFYIIEKENVFAYFRIILLWLAMF